MKKISLLFAAIFCASGLFAQKTPIIATIDIQRVLSEYNAYQAAFEKVKSSVIPVEEEMRRMQSSAQEIMSKGIDLQSEIENPSINEGRKSEAELEILEIRKQLQTLQIEIQQFRQQAQQLTQQGQRDELAPLQEKAVDIVQQVAKDMGIDLVVPSNSVLYYSEEMEITDVVIELLNASE